jgi:hypothetical protein
MGPLPVDGAPEIGVNAPVGAIFAAPTRFWVFQAE